MLATPQTLLHIARAVGVLICTRYTTIHIPWVSIHHNDSSLVTWACWPMRSASEASSSGRVSQKKKANFIGQPDHLWAVYCSVRYTDHYTSSTGLHGCYAQWGMEGSPVYWELVHLIIFLGEVNLPFKLPKVLFIFLLLICNISTYSYAHKFI